ncbi:MAG TPA: 50S ribosomal protein L6 [Stenomitos sp.]
MSRIGKRPVELPGNVKVTVDGQKVMVEGPKGKLSRELVPQVSVSVEGNVLTVNRADESREARSRHGLSRTLVANMVEGVSNGFTKSLEMVGVGYRATLEGKALNLAVGYSHPVKITPPEGVEIAVEGANKIHVKGADKQLVGDTAAEIRAVRPPEPYKGKGIKYAGEVIRRKAGKSGGKKK